MSNVIKCQSSISEATLVRAVHSSNCLFVQNENDSLVDYISSDSNYSEDSIDDTDEDPTYDPIDEGPSTSGYVPIGRLVKEQDIVRRLHNEAVLNPAPAPPKALQAPPKDLTASLMENNLSQMSLSKQTSQIQQQWKPQQLQTATSVTPQWPQQVAAPSQSVMQHWQPAPSIQWHTNNTMPAINNSAMPAWQTNGTTNNWSTSGNQFQNISSFNNKSMTMPTSFTATSNQNSSFQKPVKQLSSSEINDLLS